MNFDNTEKIINKWSTVIENMGYKGSKMKEFALYMENHCILESKNTNTSFILPKKELIEGLLDSYISSEFSPNLLPVACKILSKIENLNLENVSFNLTDKSTTDYLIDLPLNREEIIQKKSENIDVVRETEAKLVELAAEKINNAIGELNNNSEIIFETKILTKHLDLVDGPNMRLIISYNLRAKQNEPKNEKYFHFLKTEDDRYDYCLHDKKGEVFFAKKGEELLALPQYENIKYKLDELCKTLTEHEPYNYEIIEKLRF